MAALIIGVWIVRISSHRASGVDAAPESFARWRFCAGGHRVAVNRPGPRAAAIGFNAPAPRNPSDMRCRCDR